MLWINQLNALQKNIYVYHCRLQCFGSFFIGKKITNWGEITSSNFKRRGELNSKYCFSVVRSTKVVGNGKYNKF